MTTPDDIKAALAPESERLFLACVEFIRKTGVSTFQLRFSDEEDPVIWMAFALYTDGKREVAAGFDPVQAAVRLCEQLGEGGICAHCGRMTGFEGGKGGELPFSDQICWYQFHVESGRFRPGCAASHA